MLIGKTFTFSAAHSLPQLPRSHKCHRQHGHNYEVTVHVEGTLDHQNGWVMDYGDFKPFGDWLDAYVDHTNLNDQWQPSTAEVLAAAFAARFIGLVDIPDNARLHSVTVKETPKTYATHVLKDQHLTAIDLSDLTMRSSDVHQIA
jgi:6-pyruvoyltetrahydropterin/6-carboxytetrahydropterin synthase